MKGFYITVHNELIDPKHIAAMGESVWLFMWLIDGMTSVNENGIGKVQNARPIKYAEIQQEMGISDKTYRRWVNRLEQAGYVRTTRAPYGLIFTVNKAKKIFGKKSPVTIDRSHAERSVTIDRIDRSQTTELLDKNDRSNNIQSNNKANTIGKKVCVEIIEFYNSTFNTKIRVLDDRIRQIKARAKAFTVEEIKQAIENAKQDDFFNGGGSRGWQGDLDYLIRNDKNIDKYLTLLAVPDDPIKKLLRNYNNGKTVS